MSQIDLTRRAFLQRLGGVSAAAATIAVMPDFLRWRFGADAWAQDPDVTLDTFNGLAAFVWPGDDPYSTAQGESAARPGAIAANAGRHIREALDIFVPAPDDGGANDETLRLSDSIAGYINNVAISVNPVGAGGAFPSAFSRLSYADKAEVWRRLEEESQNADTSSFPEPFSGVANVLQFVAGVLPGFVQFFAFSEIDVFDPATKSLTSRPVGWDHGGYQAGQGTTPVEGWDEFIGFFQDRVAINGSDGTGERFV